jgi:adenine-specific DNA-methyltransferase
MKKSKKISLGNYSFPENKRVNNPPVGLVSSATDVQVGKTKYQHDPHIDPQLSWAGKAEGVSFEIPNVSLHIHERLDPQNIAKNFLKKRSRPTQASLFEDPYNDLPLLKAIHFYQHEQEWSNRLIAGDSNLVMNSLLQKEGMAGKVQMIYIDPPYGIKYNSNFQPFLNKRDVKENNDSDIPAEPEMIQAFRDIWELEIHSYLTHLHERLLLSRDLLTENGSIFVQISDENVHRVRILMDEVFGAENFISQINFRTAMTKPTTGLNNVFDYILWYSKDKKQLKYRPLYIPNDVNKDSYQQLFASSPQYQYSFTYGGITYSPKNGWRIPESSLKRLVDLNRVYQAGKTKGGTLKFIRKNSDFPFFQYDNTWNQQSSEQNKIYVVQTAEKIIAKCLLMTTDPGDLVFDPTCGSGTTAYVAEQWGRRWITCDTSRVAIALAKQRLMTAKFDYFELAHPDEGIKSGFKYKNVPHITLGSMANSEPPKEEVLYDHPLVDREKVRVTGPFTVEAVPSLRTKPFDGSEQKLMVSGDALARIGETNELYQWIDELKATGIRATGGKMINFGRIEPMSGTKYLHAEAELLTDSGETDKAVISFGPDFGPIEQTQVEQAISEATKLKEKPKFIIFAAFHFDPEAAKDIDQINNSKQEYTILKAQMSVDLLTADLRKKRSSNQSYWLIGQPDIEVIDKDGKYLVKVNGFDYYNPVSGEIESGSEKQIAMWMLDTDYDEQSIMPDQVFFPTGDSKRDWTKLAKALNGAVDENLLGEFTGTSSLPFDAGENKKIAVKIIDNRGIESFVVKKL